MRRTICRCWLLTSLISCSACKVSGHCFCRYRLARVQTCWFSTDAASIRPSRRTIWVEYIGMIVVELEETGSVVYQLSGRRHFVLILVAKVRHKAAVIICFSKQQVTCFLVHKTGRLCFCLQYRFQPCTSASDVATPHRQLRLTNHPSTSQKRPKELRGKSIRITSCLTFSPPRA